MRVLFLTLTFALISVGCSAGGPGLVPKTVWVAQQYALGVQCESGYEVPDTDALLRAVGVTPVETAAEVFATPTVCGAAAYSAVHHARIAAGDAAAAAQIGYTPADPPSSGALDLVWFERTESWGRQCDAAPPRPQTDPRAALRADGIYVYGFDRESLPVCRDCDTCPATTVRMSIRVPSYDAASVLALGYTRAAR